MRAAAEQIAGKISVRFLAVLLDEDYLGCRGPELIKDFLDHYHQMMVKFLIEGHFRPQLSIEQRSFSLILGRVSLGEGNYAGLVPRRGNSSYAPIAEMMRFLFDH